MSIRNDVRVAPVRWCALMVVALLASEIEAKQQRSVVRVLHPQLAQTLEHSYAVSPTIRGLVDELERSDLIVHVVGMPMQHGRPLSGAMKFVQRAGGRRFLRIFVDQRLAPEPRAGVLAHELQHAVEVARHEFVVDEATLAMLYRRIGYESGDAADGCCYETDDAKRIGGLVLADIGNFRTSAATRTTAAAGRPGS